MSRLSYTSLKGLPRVPHIKSSSFLKFFHRQHIHASEIPMITFKRGYTALSIASPCLTMDTTAEETPPLSKNKLKKQKRNQQWEANRDKRKALRKEKHKEKKLRNRAAREEAALPSSTATNGAQEANDQNGIQEPVRHHQPQPIQLPITLVIDCGFDDLMGDTERKSLGSQITRCYSDNNKAPYKAHLVISSFGGHLKERFDTLLAGHHRAWKGVRFLGEDFVEAAIQAEVRMRAPDGGRLAGALAPVASVEGTSSAAEHPRLGETVYLTSDSPHTLSTLSPYSTYIIGGIVDKNRHKGICYKKAMDRDIKTAKLPIGDYMQMSSRFVLATNHVVEIMLRWLECGDWGEAFMKVMPKRKGGVLKCNGKAEGKVGEGSRESSDTNAGVAVSSVGAEIIDGKADVTADDASQAIEETVPEQETSQPHGMPEENDGVPEGVANEHEGLQEYRGEETP